MRRSEPGSSSPPALTCTTGTGEALGSRFFPALFRYSDGSSKSLASHRAFSRGSDGWPLSRGLVARPSMRNSADALLTRVPALASWRSDLPRRALTRSTLPRWPARSGLTARAPHDDRPVARNKYGLGRWPQGRGSSARCRNGLLAGRPLRTWGAPTSRRTVVGRSPAGVPPADDQRSASSFWTTARKSDATR